MMKMFTTLLSILALVGVLATPASAQVTTQTITTTTCTATDHTGCAVFGATDRAAVGIQVTGTFVGTLTFEQTIDGTNWLTIAMTPYNSTTTVTTTTTTGLWTTSVTNVQIRARFSAFSSGSAVVSKVSTVSSRGGGGGGGAPPAGSVTEAAFSFSDVTTANATSSQHGLMPKLSGNAFDFALGDGTYGRTVARGTTTANSPWTFSQTWNNVAVDFVGIALTFTNTASSSGKFMQFNTGAGELGYLTIAGSLILPSFNGNLSTNLISVGNTGVVQFSDGTDFNAAVARVAGGSGGLKITNGSTGYQELQARDVRLQPNAVAQPACAVGIRGTIWYTASANGTPDKYEVCVKPTTDVYAWVAIAVIP